jgi:erythromycin esterase-like protein
MVRRRYQVSDGSAIPKALVGEVRQIGLPLKMSADLDPLLARIGSARVVRLGEESHGTHEYYTWRTSLTRRLVTELDFSFLAVEGDWPDCYRVNRLVKAYPEADGDAGEVLDTFHRRPTRMWANAEVRDLIGWLREYNDRRPPEAKVGFYGLDVYSLWDSLHEVMGYLRKRDPGAFAAAPRALKCFEPYGQDVQEYARGTVLVPESCQNEVVKLLTEVRAAAERAEADGRDGRFVVVERPRPAHGRDSRPAARAPRPGGEGGRLGAQHPRR